MLDERVAAFVRGESGESFGELALELFRDRYARHGPLRAWCAERGVAPDGLGGWRDLPAVPLAALGEASAAPLSSPDLARAVADRTFPAACLAGLDRPPALSLVRSAEDGEEPGLALLGERLLAAWAAPGSVAAVARRGVEAARARSFLAARQRDRRPTLLLATAATLGQLFAALARRGLRFRLPPGSRVVVAGGGPAADRELLARLAETLAIATEEVVLAYGAPGLTTRLYARRGRRGEPGAFAPPPWVRLTVIDPASGAEMPAGEPGALAVLDLAGTAPGVRLLTDDAAVAGEAGIRLAGGAAGA